jgi:UDP-N-acetylbacillosamine N-acetyltransferase
MSGGTRLVIWGASGHALVVAEILRAAGGYRLVGFLDDVDLARRGRPHGGSVILGGREQLAGLRADGVACALVAIGDCRVRLTCGQDLVEAGFELVRAIHPRACVAPGVRVGAGSVIAAGAVVGPASVVGCSAIVNTAASVDHECIIGDGAHIGPGVHLGGRVRVGRATWIGIGATVADRACVGDGAIVGAAALVLADIPPGVVAFGVPARVVRLVAGDEASSRR